MESLLWIIMEEDACIVAGLDARKKVLCDDTMYQVLQCIIGCLSAEDVCRVSKVCRHWEKVANSALIWKHFCQQEDVPLEGGDAQTDRYYKSVYADYTVVRNKWLTGQRVTTKQTHLMHPNGDKFDGMFLNSSSRHLFVRSNQHYSFTPADHVVYVFCAATGQYIRQLVGHTTGVCQVNLTSDEAMAVTRPVTGTNVRVWDVATGQCLHTLVHPADCIDGIWICGELLVCSISSSNVGSSFVWNIETGDKLHEHREMVYWCARDGSHMAISVPGLIRLLDINTWLVLRSVPWDMKYGDRILLDCGQHTLVALNDSNLRLWDTSSGSVKATYNVQRNVPRSSSITAHAGKLYLAQCGPGRQAVTVYDMASGAILDKIRGSIGDSCCYALPVLSNGLLVVEGHDWVSIWDIKGQVHGRYIHPPHQGIVHCCNASVNRMQYVIEDGGYITYVMHNFDP